MSTFTASASFRHDRPARTGVLLLQLGTPSAPEPGPVRRYLTEFLSDARVVEIPRAVWMPILHGIILRTRPAKSARKYASIWTRDGSPLMFHTTRRTELLRGYLGDAGHDVEVAFGMRYGEPSIPQSMRSLRERGVERLLVIPLYPQYAGSTTATGLDAVYRELMRWRNPPELRTVKHFHDRTDYLDALAARIRSSWGDEGPPDQLVMSFHGVPRRTLLLGDPYHCECLATGRLLAERLNLPRDRWHVTFQSRFGKAEWLQPYTEPTLEAMARSGVRRVDVVCPGFVADCLETLEEIALEGRQAFLKAGGKDYRYIPCLNDSPGFIRSLMALAVEHMAGWPTRRRDSADRSRQRAALAARSQAAKVLGAER
jgi:ferrochelatase